MQLSNEERETIITFDETSADAVVFTYNRAWQKQIEKKLGIKPSMNNGFGGKEYQVPKKRIRMPQPLRILSPEQREKLAKRLSQGRLQKSIISSKSNTAQDDSQAKTSGKGKNHCRQKTDQNGMSKRLKMTITDLIFTALCMLLGTEDIDYLIFERDQEEWQVVSWLHRN